MFSDIVSLLFIIDFKYFYERCYTVPVAFACLYFNHIFGLLKDVLNCSVVS